MGNAIQAWNKGSPVMSDPEFDELKSSLKESGSAIAVDKEPQCWVDTGVCKVTWSVDNLRLTSLYLPAAIISTLLFIGIADEIPGVASSVNILILLALGAVPISALTKSITENLIFDKPFVAGGPCPKCGVENRVFRRNPWSGWRRRRERRQVHELQERAYRQKEHLASEHAD